MRLQKKRRGRRPSRGGNAQHNNNGANLCGAAAAAAQRRRVYRAALVKRIRTNWVIAPGGWGGGPGREVRPAHKNPDGRVWLAAHRRPPLLPGGSGRLITRPALLGGKVRSQPAYPPGGPPTPTHESAPAPRCPVAADARPSAHTSRPVWLRRRTKLLTLNF